MLTFTNINAESLGQVNAIRSKSNVAGALSLRGGGATHFSFPHDIYTIGLNELTQPGEPAKNLTGQRVVETSAHAFNYIFDVFAKQGTPGVNMLHDETFIADYEKAFEKLHEADAEPNNYIVRNLRVPALHVDALWLHDENNPANDKYLAVRGMALFEGNRFYNTQSFFAILKETAAKINSSDDLVGG